MPSTNAPSRGARVGGVNAVGLGFGLGATGWVDAGVMNAPVDSIRPATATSSARALAGRRWTGLAELLRIGARPSVKTSRPDVRTA